MSPKTKTTKRKTVKKKSPCNKIIHSSLLLPREIFATERQQLIVSILMLSVLIIQVYLFISIFRIVEQIAQLQGA